MTTTTNPVATVGLDALDILMNDHVAIKGLVTDLAGATDSARRKDIFAQLKAVLTIHNATEENLYLGHGINDGVNGNCLMTPLMCSRSVSQNGRGPICGFPA